MGLLSRLRAWIAGATGDGESAAPPDDSEGEETAENDENGAEDEPTGLDPSAATETRTAAATDDAVDALRDVRRSQGAAPTDADADPDNDGSGDGDAAGSEDADPDALAGDGRDAS